MAKAARKPSGADTDSTTEMEVIPPGVERRERNLRPPWQPGQSGNPMGRSVAQISAYQAARQMCAQATPKAVEKQIALLDSEDERIVMLASAAIIERGAGKVRDHSQEEDRKTRVNLDALSDDDRKALAMLLRKALGG